MSTCGKYSQHQNKNPDPCRPVMMGNSDPRVSIPAGFPTGIPVVSRGLPGLVLSLTDVGGRDRPIEEGHIYARVEGIS
jgi:hypothetical protein